MEKIQINEDYDELGFAKEPKITNLFETDEYLIFSSIIDKYNWLNWKQKRNIVITNKYIYNLKNTSLKRKIRIKDTDGITLSSHPSSNEFVIHVSTEYDYLYSSEKYIYI